MFLMLRCDHTEQAHLGIYGVRHFQNGILHPATVTRLACTMRFVSCLHHLDQSRGR